MAKRRFTVDQRLDQLEETVDDTNDKVYDIKEQLDSEAAERNLYSRKLGAFSDFAMNVYNRLDYIEYK